MAFVAVVISQAMSVEPKIRRSTARYRRFNSGSVRFVTELDAQDNGPRDSKSMRRETQPECEC